MDAAGKLGLSFLDHNLSLVYGGAGVGLMGVIANTFMENNGDVIGVIPKALFDKEVAYTNLTDLRVVDTMHERKSLMAELSDGFIAMPGGLGTIEEFFEVLTWAQLGIHRKPCGLLNVNGYFDRLTEFLDHAVSQRFIEKECRSLILMDHDPEILIRKMKAYHAPEVDKAKWALGMVHS
jgi:uncharacterized protein (TIGR00730 family)